MSKRTPTFVALVNTTQQVFSSPLFKLSVSVVLLWLVFKQVNLPEIGAKILTANLADGLLYVVGSISLAWLASLRWSLLIFDKPDLKQVTAFFKATMLGLFYNLFMPSSVGGDALKWTALTHLNVPKSLLIFTMLLDRLMGMFALIVIGFITMILASFFQLAQVPLPVWYLFSGLFFGTIIFFGFVFSPINFKNIPLLRRFAKLAVIEEYLESHRKQFLGVFSVAIVVQLIAYFLMYILSLAVGFTVPLYQFLIVGPLVGLIVTLPISFAGFGATEVAYLYFFGQLGESQTTILAMTSLGAVFRFILGFIGWLTGVLIKD